MPQRWALLCGGDYYTAGKMHQTRGSKLDGPKYLNGCVRDVEVIARYLTEFDVPEENIRTLTATVRPSGDGPVEASDRWPTRSNIQRELQIISNEARSTTEDTDRLLYFHYSGHGTLRKEVSISDDDEGSDDFKGTALVMTDVASGGAYLTGRQLGLWVKKMVENDGFRATVVLDSCFSGDGFRNDPHDVFFTARYVDVIDGSIPESDQIAEQDLMQAEDDDQCRDAAGIRTFWLSNPEKCTVITACSRSQMAGETMFESNGQMATQGILTYWLVRALSILRPLKSQSTWPSHARTIDYVQRKIVRRQTPKIYGDDLFEFFGLVSYDEGESAKATCDGQGIVIDIGHAQGVRAGAVYTIVADGDTSEVRRTTRIRVTSVDRFQSWGVDLNPFAVAIWPPQEILRATLHQWALLMIVHVYCPITASEWDLLTTELAETPGLVLGDGVPSVTDLVIKLDNDNTFRILQNGKPLRRLPIISFNEPTGLKRLAQLLSHIARFQTLKEFYSSSYSHQLPEADFELIADIEAADGDVVDLSLRYRGNLSSLWVSVYCFAASWGISKLSPPSGASAEHLDVRLGETEESISIAMSVPSKCRQDDPDQIEDDIFFFISTSPDHQLPPSWGDICLPSIMPNGDIKPMEWAYPQPRLQTCGSGTGGRDIIALEETAPSIEWVAIRHTIRTNNKPDLTACIRESSGD